jgi:hypothetical protein
MKYFIGIVAPAQVDDEVMEFKRYVEKHYECRVALRSFSVQLPG